MKIEKLIKELEEFKKLGFKDVERDVNFADNTGVISDIMEFDFIDTKTLFLITKKISSSYVCEICGRQESGTYE